MKKIAFGQELQEQRSRMNPDERRISRNRRRLAAGVTAAAVLLGAGSGAKAAVSAITKKGPTTEIRVKLGPNGIIEDAAGAVMGLEGQEASGYSSSFVDTEQEIESAVNKDLEEHGVVTGPYGGETVIIKVPDTRKLHEHEASTDNGAVAENLSNPQQNQ